jgi:hypothetical protein
MGQPAPTPTAPQPPDAAAQPDAQAAQPPVAAEAQWRPSRRTWIIIGAVLAALALLVAVVLVAAALDDDGPGRGDRVVTGPLRDGDRDRDAATFELLTGAASVTVRAGDLGDHLYRAATPADSDLVPQVDHDGDRVLLHLAKRGPDGPDAVEVTLNQRVRWTVRIVAGAVEEVLDLGAGRVAGLDVVGGASRIEVRLPRPQGGVSVRMSGGASQFLLRVPTDVPVRARLGSGAGSVTVDGTTRSGVAAGTVIAPPGWDGATDRYDIDAIAGVSALTVERWNP